MKLRLLCLALVCLCVGVFVPARASGVQDSASIVAEIKKLRDEADPQLIAQLGNLRTRDAMTALIDLYDTTFGSVYMRREVVKALGSFDGVADAEQPALQKLTDIATTATEIELRSMAIDTIGSCRNLGKHFLKTIVESNADDDMRERAMQMVVSLATDDDKDFFERAFKGPSDEEKKEDKKLAKKDKDKDAAPEKRAAMLRSIRELAFERVAKTTSIEKLYEYAREKDANDPEAWGVRRLALLEIETRKDKGLYELAKTIYDDNVERGVTRGEAARILAEADGAKIAPKFLEDGRANPAVTPASMSRAIADELARMRDEATDKKLVALVGKGKIYEQRFVLRALRGYKDDKFLERLIKYVEGATKKAPPTKNSPEYNEQRDLVLDTIEVLGDSKSPAAQTALTTLVDAAKDPKVVADSMILAGAMDALGKLTSMSGEWRTKLEALAGDKRAEVRNGALLALGRTGDKKYVPTLVAALEHADWSTRYAALEGLEASRSPEAVGALVGRLDKETGLMLVRFTDALFRLSGKPFRNSIQAWKGWWDKEGKGFQPITLADLAKLQAEEEVRRLKQITKTPTFFGVRILSHRVIFIIDVSGSMNETLRSEYVGKTGKPRMEVAKQELTACIDALEPESLFNIVVFSSDVNQWLDGGVASYSKSNKDEAKKYVATLGAGGATNLYDALKQAFSDPDVDTIFVLSDGEPTAGEVVDPTLIRDRVKTWNEKRRIVLHTIAVGGSFQVLEWIAADSGGTHKKIQ
jgi:HEAT repeat protein